MAAPPDSLLRVRAQAASGQIRLTLHAQQEMAAESITLDDALHAIATGAIIEDYPDHQRGACCLIHGVDVAARDIHVVCTTAQPLLIIITVYLPQPPKWMTPTRRRSQP